MKVSRSDIYRVVEACIELGAKKATIYVALNLVVKASRRFKANKRDAITEVLITIGRPNFEERRFIKACLKTREKFPVKKIQLKWYPKGGEK